MKNYLILFVFVLVLFTGCTDVYTPVTNATEVSIAATEAVKNKDLVCYYTYSDNSHDYYFNEDKQLVQVYYTGDDLVVDSVWYILLVVVFIIAVIL